MTYKRYAILSISGPQSDRLHTAGQPRRRSAPQAIHPDPVTGQWLHTLTPPPEANHYFKLIGDQQKSIEDACGH